MNIKKVLSTSFKSIVWGSLFLVAYTIVELLINHDLKDGFFQMLIFFMIFYFMISIAGWLAIGLPIHLAISALDGNYYYLYPLAALVFFAVLVFVTNFEMALVFGLAALIQACIFAYYVYKSEKVRLSSH